MDSKVLILDFGSQYTQLIARVIRKLNVYCEIHPFTMSEAEINAFSPQAIILSGSPFSIYQDKAPRPEDAVWKLGVPLLGICYGMQLVAEHFGAKVAPANRREYGFANLNLQQADLLLAGLNQQEQVWMSHGDALAELPACMEVLATTDNAPFAAIRHSSLPIYALQFHPEVVHTVPGEKVLGNFIFQVCKLNPDWNAGSFVNDSIARIRKTVGTDKVLLGLSGGVDSSVTAVLIYKAIGAQLLPVFVDTGLMRYREMERIKEMFSVYPDLNIRYVDAGEIFLQRLKGVSDPETKRKIIGTTFIEVFEGVAKEYEGIKFLAQGTLYPDVIESVSVSGPSVTIKSHHNVGGLPDRMNLQLLEPLRNLFKDEVREAGACLDLSSRLLQRHPFPGPGLAVRIIGAVDAEKVRILQLVDEIFISELIENNLYHSTWQAFAVLLPVHSVGVMGDERSYDQVCALRAVNSVDGMTADCTELPLSFLKKVASRIVSEVRGVSRVVYDLSSKPPATIEWE